MSKYIIFLFLCALSDATDPDEFLKERNKLLKDEALLAVGGKTNLTDKEEIVSNCLMKHKFKELDYAFSNPEYFNYSHHYFTYKDIILNSKVYKILKDVPKGGLLHFHDMGILGADYLMNLTYMDHLYICLKYDKIKFKFSDKNPQNFCPSEWKLISEVRRSTNNVTEFDAEIRKHFTIIVDNPDKVYPSIKESWNAFIEYFKVVVSLLTYRPVWEQYFYDALKEFRKHHLSYAEVRSVLPALYELDGTTYDSIITAKSYQKVIRRFLKKYPEFIGVKLIYAPQRYVNRITIGEYFKLAKRLKQEMSDIFAGFDLVGQEDAGGPLIEFLPQLIEEKNNFNYFFHAGETNWYGTLTDENLADAILLGAKRLGHAYALPKHPLMMQKVKELDIGLEVNVISNTVLSLVRDLRNHPLSTFLAQGMPVVLSSDDPGAWGTDPITSDFYLAFVGVASHLSDLKLVKELAFNSIKYSALGTEDKLKAIDNLSAQWNVFVNNFKCSSY